MSIGSISSTGIQNVESGTKSKKMRLYQNKTSERTILGTYQNSFKFEVDEDAIDTIDKLKNYIVRKGARCVYDTPNSITDYHYIQCSSIYPLTNVTVSAVLAVKRTATEPYETWSETSLCIVGLTSGTSAVIANTLGNTWNLEYVEEV